MAVCHGAALPVPQGGRHPYQPERGRSPIMTVDQFRRMALSLPEVEERGHMDHPDFRVGGKIFATLGYPDKSWGMVSFHRSSNGSSSRPTPTCSNPPMGPGDCKEARWFSSSPPTPTMCMKP